VKSTSLQRKAKISPILNPVAGGTYTHWRNGLAFAQERLNRLGEVCIPDNVGQTGLLKFKSEDDYFAVIGGGIQRRSRDHERLVRRAAEYFSAHAATVTTQHPIDLLMTLPKQVIFEAKILRGRNAISAIREAIGQLFEYQHFIGPKAGLLFILLDENPGRVLVEYVENVLELGICWMQGGTLFGGPHSGPELSACGVVAVSPSG
jgi:hypothetical protein